MQHRLLQRSNTAPDPSTVLQTMGNIPHWDHPFKQLHFRLFPLQSTPLPPAPGENSSQERVSTLHFEHATAPLVLCLRYVLGYFFKLKQCCLLPMKLVNVCVCLFVCFFLITLLKKFE